MSDTRAFETLPAIDLRGGRVVRLRQGDFARETLYGDDPIQVARRFEADGARWIHVVDLDGARAGQPMQLDLVGALVADVGQRIRVEAAGGLRTADAVSRLLALGAARAVLGTAAIDDPALVGSLVSVHGADRIAVAIDVRAGRAIGHGWSSGAVGIDAADAIHRLADVGVNTFEVTAIERDGLLLGPDLALYDNLVQLGRGEIIASGGIATMDDLRALRARGCAGAILGRALYEGWINLAEALALDREQ